MQKYGSNHDIIYNSKKLKDLKSPPLYLCNNQLDYVNNCRYLGVKIETYSCKSDMKRQLCKFYANANMLIRKFSFCFDDVKVFLFKSYCTNLYCTQFWYDSSETLMKKLCVGYNNSLRRLMKLDKHCSASEMFVHYGIPAFGELQRKHITNFIHRLQSSSNSIIMSVVLSSVPLSSLIWGYWFNTLHTSK